LAVRANNKCRLCVDLALVGPRGDISIRHLDTERFEAAPLGGVPAALLAEWTRKLRPSRVSRAPGAAGRMNQK
jgi:hypothetical protein